MTFDPTAEAPDADEVTEIVDDAIEDNDVVLFVKGTRHMPQCGYSRRALGLVAEHRREFEVVDVLPALDAFRAALARHSGWETIPQAYVNGEFVGGSDVLAELAERGELAETLDAN